MPPTIDNPTDRAKNEGDDADWARWEQNFRDARPVLPELAIARIEAAIEREARRHVPPRRSRLRQWILLLLGALVLINCATVLILTHLKTATPIPAPGTGERVSLIQERFPMDVTVGAPLVAPDRAILSGMADFDPITNSPDQKLTPPTPVPGGEILKAAEKAAPNWLDGWHQLGLLEMRRSAGISAPLPTVFPPHDGDFMIVSEWRMLPLDEARLNDFSQQLYRLGDTAFQNSGHQLSPDQLYWTGIYKLILARHDGSTPTALPRMSTNAPIEFPSRLGDRARFDLFTELGETKAQAALDVLTTRSYQPLAAIARLALAEKYLPVYQRPDYRPIARDVVDLAFAMALMKQQSDAIGLLADARKIRYLNDPQDLAVLLARLGPEDAWSKLLKPLMDNEAAFVENPPKLDDTAPASLSTAIVESSTKSMTGTTTTYLGPILRLSAAPWRITCDRLTPFHNADEGFLLTGSGKVRVEGILGLYSATADDMTLNTHTGDLKLSGHVHLEGWTVSRDMKSCIITRSNEVTAGN